MRREAPTPGSLDDLQPDADPEQVARTILIRRLTMAPRSRADLRSDLVRRGIPDEVADRVLDRFTEVGLIDDQAFAAAWVDSRHRSRGMARSMLKRELRQRGIDDPTADEALSSIDADQERARALDLARVKARSIGRLEPAAQVRRLMGVLQRRGYPAAVAASVAREVLDETMHPLLDSDDGVG